jgi:hypothetical protein
VVAVCWRLERADVARDWKSQSSTSSISALGRKFNGTASPRIWYVV